MIPFAGDLLIVFVTFPGDQHHIARAGKLHRPADGFAAVRFRFVCGSLRNPGHDFPDDRFRIFIAWIVAGDDQKIGELRRLPPHAGSFGAVAVAAAP